MRLLTIIYFSLAVVCFIIGVHQVFFYGVVNSYWLFMLVALFWFLYKLQNKKELEAAEADKTAGTTPKASIKKRVQAGNKARKS